MKFLIHCVLFLISLTCFSQKNRRSDTLLTKQLLSHAVLNDDFIRDTLYTWTTSSQIIQLKENRKLLAKYKSDEGGLSLYDQSLQDTAFKKNTLIQLLKQPQFSKKRFAWASSWPTSLGMNDEKYGDQLIKIILKPDAIIGKLDVRNMGRTIQFFNLKGDTLGNDYVTENQNRIAVVFHINWMQISRTQQQMRNSGSFVKYINKYKKENVSTGFREFVIINESMINWSYGTVDIKKGIAAEIAFLKSLQQSEFSNSLGYKTDCTWLENFYMNDNDIDCAFESVKCFNSDDYLFHKKRLQKIIDQLSHALKAQSEPITN